MTEPMRHTPKIVCTMPGVAGGSKAYEIIPHRNPKTEIVEFRPRSGEIVRDNVIVALSAAHAELFAALYKRWLAGDDKFASGATLYDSKVYGGPFDRRLRMNANRRVHRVSQIIAPLRIRIETKPRYGYRLRVDP